MEPLQIRNHDNEFDKIFDKGYGSRFAKIMEASMLDRFDYMAATASYAYQDENLSDKQKKLMEELELSFKDASFITKGEIPRRLLNLIDSKPNLKKMIKPSREQRIYDTLMMIPKRLGFASIAKANFLPLFFTTMAITYGNYKYLKHDMAYSKVRGTQNISGLYFTALLAKYANNVGLFAYSDMWFILMLMKTLSSSAITPEKILLEHPEVYDYAENLFKTVEYMIDTIEPDLYNGIEIAESSESSHLDK